METLQQEAEKKAAEAAAEVQKLVNANKEVPAEKLAETEAAAKAATERMKAAEAAKTEAAKRMRTVTDTAAPKDIVDIVVSEPIRIRVTAAAGK
jgi:membrane protein involved in colicin uptake